MDPSTSPIPTPSPTDVGPCVWDFPDPATSCDENDVLAVGADLAPATLVHAYRNGFFPWPHGDGPLPWFSPHPRAVVPLDRAHVSRSLRKHLAKVGWTTTADHAFADVMDACGHRPDSGTWITPAMKDAYCELHRLGWAHSIEVWDNSNALVGGIYGVLVGGIFTGESMFHRATGASKVALVELCARLHEGGGSLLDVQLPTDHLLSMGAVVLARPLYLELLHELRDDEVRIATDRRLANRLSTLVINVED